MVRKGLSAAGWITVTVPLRHRRAEPPVAAVGMPADDPEAAGGCRRAGPAPPAQAAQAAGETTRARTASERAPVGLTRPPA
ncbi:hypothetical protein GCM10010508_37760 [Streptomyces naganishii JCM 4654]|uniref:Uncharacterized protein n=1 Tax=Streptomyces naganishii JCM 4654 TaxID=1306179 RepID=A0A918Y5X3_9ACTN|nr:hypothetical protein GCM10010508_37760 [Streptomyces naganishii JCM 4654]